ncbi:MAG: hypothetical protein KJ000_09990 [Pirellulaceae bacterium]|nr:hypothetical protein [Pirellulaceae bacterium]
MTWTYDASNRLTREQRSAPSAYDNTYTYDGLDNRLVKDASGELTTSTYDLANQLVTSQDANGVTTHTYDLAGNLHLVEQPTGQRTTTTWDDQNRQTGVLLPDGSAVTNTFRYDGLRYSKQEPQSTTKFLWDVNNYLAETDADDDIQAVYTNEPQPYGNLISQYRKGPTIWLPSYYQYDALGATRVLTNDAGDMTDTYLYDAWGNELAVTGTTVTPFGWVGQVGYYWDEGTGTFYIRARVYEPVTGRWMSQDPLFYPVANALAGFGTHTVWANLRYNRNRYYVGSADSVNLRQYAGDNPLVLSDPTGLAAVKLAYPVVCTWCRKCKVSFLRQACSGFIWAKRPWTDCTKPTVVSCPLPVGEDGKPLTTDRGQVYLEPRACCKSKRPRSYSHYCTAYWEEESHTNPRVDPPMTNCDKLMFSWIANAGGSQGTQPHADCMEWCEKCFAKIGINDGTDMDVKQILKKECIDGTCNYAYG